VPKGIYERKVNNGFKKGHKQSNSGKTHFKKGCTPWNKEKKLGNNLEHSERLTKAWKDGKFKNKVKNTDYKLNAKKISATRQGIDLKNWKGYKSTLMNILRNSIKWKNWRKEVFERDNHTCQKPNCPYCNNKKGVTLHPHHIKPKGQYPELVFDIHNGIAYCEEFHLKSNLHGGD